MTDFWREIEQGAKCIRLVEQFLEEEEHNLNWLKDRGKTTSTCEFKIARMKYALGEISTEPDYASYFPTKDKYNT